MRLLLSHNGLPSAAPTIIITTPDILVSAQIHHNTICTLSKPGGGDSYQLNIEGTNAAFRSGLQVTGQNANGQFGVFNSSFATVSLRNRAALLSSTDLVLAGNAATWAGGSTSIILSPGGNDNEIARFTGAGLGIGTTTPTTNLSVKGGLSLNQTGLHAVGDFYTPIAYDRARLTIGKTSNTNGFSSALTFYGYNTAGTALENKWEIGTDLFTNSTNNFYLWNTKINEAQLFLHDSGNVGVLTTDPISNFQVQDGCTKASLGEADGGGLNFGTSYLGFNAARSGGSWNVSSDGGQSDGSGGNNGGGVIYSSIFGDMYFSIIPGLPLSSGHTERTLVDADIVTGIALKISHTNGAVYAKQIYVQTGIFPDYVFKKDYKLMPLSEVKTYIEKNNHLPEMPTAAEVEKNGLNLGEVNKLLTKKVEELTLYLIEKDKKIKDQEEKTASIEERMKKMEEQFEILTKKVNNKEQ